MLEDIETDDGPLTGRPAFVDLMEIFQDASEMPSPEQGPGEEFVDNLNKVFMRLILYVQQARTFLAKVHDVLCHFGPGVSLGVIKRLLERSERLPVILEEAIFLRDQYEKGFFWEGQVERIMEGQEGPGMEVVRRTLLLSEVREGGGNMKRGREETYELLPLCTNITNGRLSLRLSFRSSP